MFSLSTMQPEGHSQFFFQIKNIQKDVTINSDIDKRIQERCFRQDRFGLSK